MKSMKSVLLPASAAALFALAGSAPAAADSEPIDIEAVQVDTVRNTLTVAGGGLGDVDELTLTNDSGEEIILPFELRKVSRSVVALKAKLQDDAPGTYRLRVYSNNQLADQLDVTVTASAAHALNSASVVQVENNAVCDGTRCSVLMECPAGYAVVGGGYYEQGYAHPFYADTTLPISRPEGSNAWRIEAKAINPKVHHTYVKGYAVCVRVETPKVKLAGWETPFSQGLR